MTKEEIRAFIEKHGNAEAIVEEIRKMNDEGMEVTEKELERRLRAVEQSLGAMEKQFTKPDAPEYEKVPTKVLRRIARADINWLELMKVYGLCLLPLLACTILMAVFQENIVIQSISGAATIIWSAVMTCGLYRRFLDIRRGAKKQSFFSEASHTPSMLLLMLLKGLMVIAPLVPGVILAMIKPIVGGVLLVLGFLAAIFVGLTYSQAEFNLIEGGKAIQSLKLSRLAMKEDRARYFVMMIPIFLWTSLAEIAATLIAAVPMAVRQFNFMPTSLIVLYIVAVFAFLLPIGIYQLMCQAEFYDELRGIELEEKSPEGELKVFVIMVAVAAALLLTSLIIV